MASTLPRTRLNEPLIVVVGATGTGKSQLAVELAKRFNGEIINGDAMQLYEGLPIITNKITAREKQGIPHHLLGTIGLTEPTWVVSTFVKQALTTMAEIRARGRIPILAGGTHYYTQSLLFHDALSESDAAVDTDSSADTDNRPLEEQWPILAQPTEVILEELQKVDPVMANRWHPRDRRKIQSSLRIYLQTGRRASDLYAEQQSRKSKTMHADQIPLLRYPQTLLFWTHAEQDVLRTRLDKRVDKMLDVGLLDEVKQLRSHLADQASHGGEVDESRGIWVSIGFKEFKLYQDAVDRQDSTSIIAAAKSEGIERTKIATRQYAKGQVRWIRIKLVKALREANSSDSLFLLDGTDIDKFDETVVQPAIELAAKFLNEQPLPSPGSISTLAATMLCEDSQANGQMENDFSVRHCAICNVSCATRQQWEAHARSKAHRKLSAKAQSRDPGEG